MISWATFHMLVDQCPSSLEKCQQTCFSPWSPLTILKSSYLFVAVAAAAAAAELQVFFTDSGYQPLMRHDLQVFSSHSIGWLLTLLVHIFSSFEAFLFSRLNFPLTFILTWFYLYQYCGKATEIERYGEINASFQSLVTGPHPFIIHPSIHSFIQTVTGEHGRILELLKRKLVQNDITCAKAHNTKPPSITWLNRCFNLSQKCNVNQLAWNFLVNTTESSVTWTLSNTPSPSVSTPTKKKEESYIIKNLTIAFSPKDVLV